jgi:hypothetical protein
MEGIFSLVTFPRDAASLETGYGVTFVTSVTRTQSYDFDLQRQR